MDGQMSYRLQVESRTENFGKTASFPYSLKNADERERVRALNEHTHSEQIKHMHAPTQIRIRVWNSHQLSSLIRCKACSFLGFFQSHAPFRRPIVISKYFLVFVSFVVCLYKKKCVRQNGYPSSNNTSLCSPTHSLSLSLFPHTHTHIYTIIVALDLLRTASPPKNYRCARGSIGSIDMTTHFTAVISRFSIHFFSFLCIYCCIRVCSLCMSSSFSLCFFSLVCF